jgi:ribosomal protein S18 acetylase RimI-like enzyme
VLSEQPRIRGYQRADLEELYRICLLTADNGDDATTLFRDPKLPGHVWLGPYLAFESSLAFVAEDAGGVAGYVVAALDSPAFEDRLEREWWPPLRARYPDPAHDSAEVVSAIERITLNDLHRPGGAGELADCFPSHLHIDLLPRIQGRGIGRQLMAAAMSHLRERGSRGLHLMAGRDNERAAGFYRHLGFRELPHSYLRIFTMDLR